jgi:hypothetical protein
MCWVWVAQVRRRDAAMTILTLAFAPVSFAQTNVIKAASRFVPGVKWKADSVVVADFTCEGHKQQAILGIDAKEMTVVAVFLHGLAAKPEVLKLLRYVETVRLEAEALDYEPDYPLRGYRQSKTCKGLAVIDDSIDAAHLYWDHIDHRFGSWSN